MVRKLNICVQRLSGACHRHIRGCSTDIPLATFPDPQQAADDLTAFAKFNEGRLYKLLETCMDTQASLKSLVKSSV
jgi:hypothetical protein